jgi:hypothetical protein
MTSSNDTFLMSLTLRRLMLTRLGQLETKAKQKYNSIKK